MFHTEKPPHVQAHFILLVTHKIKRAFTSSLPPNQIIVVELLINRLKLIYLHHMQINMNKKVINRLKVILAEHSKTNKWLAEKLNKNETTISRWCTNEVQPSLETLIEISELLNIDVKELINSTLD